MIDVDPISEILAQFGKNRRKKGGRKLKVRGIKKEIETQVLAIQKSMEENQWSKVELDLVGLMKFHLEYCDKRQTDTTLCRLAKFAGEIQAEDFAQRLTNYTVVE